MKTQYLGLGLGLRSCHTDEVLALTPQTTSIQWFEVITENFMGSDQVGFSPRLKTLMQVRRNFPIVMHGVSLSIGSTDELDWNYLKRAKELYSIVEPAWTSDHLCWTGVAHKNSHDLLPLPYNKETIAHVVDRIQKVQDFLGRKILIENVSSYAEFKFSEMPEWEFVSEIVKKSGCGLLLDVNNIFVSSSNHGFDPNDYLNHLPLEHVGQIHLAGPDYTEIAATDNQPKQTYYVDTHDSPVLPEVWALFEKVISQTGPVSTLLEWDERIPAFADLVKEAEKALPVLKKYSADYKPTHSNLMKDLSNLSREL